MSYSWDESVPVSTAASGARIVERDQNVGGTEKPSSFLAAICAPFPLPVMT
jgi:hypothetical protein